jgi:hypothetical protein
MHEAKSDEQYDFYLEFICLPNKLTNLVVGAKAGIQFCMLFGDTTLGPCLRGDDGFA